MALTIIEILEEAAGERYVVEVPIPGGDGYHPLKHGRCAFATSAITIARAIGGARVRRGIEIVWPRFP